jgi:hypothetical protein
VEETIAVNVEHRQINHGIYRTLVTIYTANGERTNVNFDIVSVLRDHAREPYHTQRGEGQLRVYIGSKDHPVPLGRHVYTLVYRAKPAVAFFEGFDELYWNVTGNYWPFDIEHAGATVHLPKGTSPLRYTAYTGRTGERGRDFRYSVPAGDIVHFETTRTLHPGEGLTIAVAWPKGFIDRAALGAVHRPYLALNSQRDGK